MARKDIYRDTVKKALQKDGWSITSDPLQIAYGRHNLYVDLGAESAIGAEKDGQKIAVEIKSFINDSPVTDLYQAVGQYNVYRDIMEETAHTHQIFLAISNRTYVNVFEDELGAMVRRRQRMLLIVFDPVEERVEQWIK